MLVYTYVSVQILEPFEEESPEDFVATGLPVICWSSKDRMLEAFLNEFLKTQSEFLEELKEDDDDEETKEERETHRVSSIEPVRVDRYHWEWIWDYGQTVFHFWSMNIVE